MTVVDHEVMCPKCGGKTWDNRETKKNPKAPDYKCRDRSCEGVVWPAKNGAAPVQRAAAPVPARAPLALGEPQPYDEPTVEVTADPFPLLAALYRRSLKEATVALAGHGIDKMGGDVAGAVVAAAATIFIQANKQR